MKRIPTLLPFALFIVVLPFPNTVALRLLLLAICFGVALWHWWRVPGARAAIPCKAALLAWWGVCIASLTYSGDVAYTASELKNELGYTMMAFFSFFVLAADRATALWLLRAVGAGFALIGLWAALAWAANGFVWDVAGRYGGFGVFSAYIVTVVPVLALLSLTDPQARVRRFAVGLLVLAVFLAVIAMQRAAWPALAVQAAVGLVYAFRRRLLAIGWRRMALAVVAIAVVGGAGLQYIQYVRSAGTESRLSDDVRVPFWPGVVAKIAEHPLVGAGFGQQMMHKAYPELTPKEVPDLWHAHNVLLNYGLQLGVPGIIAFVALLAAFANLFRRSPVVWGGWVSAAGLMLISGVLVRNQFNDFFIRDMSLLFWALTGILARLAVAAPQGNSNDRQTPD